jgi:hypothetical protein
VRLSRYGRGMPTTRSGTAGAFVVIAALALAGCGGSTTTASTSTAAPSSSEAPSDGAPAGALVVVRTGGIAGVVDMVSIAADGTANVTNKTRKSRPCKPSAESLDRLQAIDLSAVRGAPSTSSQLADGFNYSVTSGGTSATASEGDDDSRRAELVDAAADVVATCLAKQS